MASAAVKITACHIASQEGKFEPRRRNNFMLVFPPEFKVAQQTLQTCSTPTLECSPISIPYGNQEKKVASAGTVSDIEFSCFDDMDGNVSNALLGWYELAYQGKTGVVGLAKDYKKECSIISAKPNGEKAVEWKLKGAWISRLTPLGDGFDMNAKTDIVVISGTITVDTVVKS